MHRCGDDSLNAGITRPEGRAAFSRCGRYRWWLSRRWRRGAPTLLFIGLNPSSADGRRDDPTLRRLVGFADGWGYGSLEVLNLFAWISADPTALRRAAEPVGRRNDAWLQLCVRRLLQHNGTGPDATGLTAGLATPAPRDEGVRPESRSQPGDQGDRRPEALLPLWLGWGNGGRWRGRDQQMLQRLGHLPVRLLCLGQTVSGQPRHPLYVCADSPLRPFAASWMHLSAPPDAPCPAPRAATRST